MPSITAQMPHCAVRTCGRRLPGGFQFRCVHCAPEKDGDANCGPPAYCAEHRMPEDHACSGLGAMRRKLREGLRSGLKRDAEVAADKHRHVSGL